MSGGAICRFCGCYVPKSFSHCPACHEDRNAVRIEPRNVLKAVEGAPMVPEPVISDSRRELIECFRSHIKDKYGVEVNLYMRERPAGLGGMECIVELNTEDGVRMGSTVGVGPAARYDDEMFVSSVLNHIEGKILRQLRQDYKEYMEELVWDAKELHRKIEDAAAETKRNEEKLNELKERIQRGALMKF